MKLSVGLSNRGYSNGHPAATVIPGLLALAFGLACAAFGAATLLVNRLCRLLPAAVAGLRQRRVRRGRVRRRRDRQARCAGRDAAGDPLTGLLNRRALNEVFLRECERADRVDRALQSVADILRAQLRGIDVISRVGGEEFCVLRPNCTTADAFLRAEAVRLAVAQDLEARGLPVTVSIGSPACGPVTSTAR